ALTQELAVRAGELEHLVDSAAGGLRRVPPLAVEETRLQREVTMAEQAVVNLQQRHEEARLATVSSLPDVKLVDPATEPQEPATNWAPLVIGLALIVGLGAGVTGAVVLDRTDRRVQYPEDVTSTMGLNILGVVPHLGRNGHAKHHEGVLQVLEAVRAIRLNVLHAHGVGPAIVTVTSPGRADGKSFLASNLAVAFADAGYRTLLIDGDIRCSMVLVLRTGVSDRALMQTKLGVLDHLPIRVLGAVLNGVVPGGVYRYYSYYLEGYEAKDEPAGAAGQVLRAPE